jgi:hypothetical protein
VSKRDEYERICERECPELRINEDMQNMAWRVRSEERIEIPRNQIIVSYIINASHSKKLSSSIGPAVIPSGGFTVSSA